MLLSFRLYFEVKKVVIFFYTGKGYRNNLEYFRSFFDKNKYKIYTIFQYKLNERSEKVNDVFFIGHRWLRYINTSDVLFTASVCTDIRTKLNVYFHHDIIDTPLGDEKTERENYKIYLKTDIILVSNKFVRNKFINDFTKYFPKKIKPKIFYVGYNKININPKAQINKNILVAPTNSRIIKKYKISLVNKKIFHELIKIIKEIFPNHKIIFRLHPNDHQDYFVKFDNKLINLDKNIDNLETFSKSDFLVTDISGTGYTFALGFKKPVIFFQNNTSKIPKKIQSSQYYKNIKFIGRISNFKTIKNDLLFIKNNKKRYQFNKVKNKFFDFNQFEETKKFFKNNINNIL